MERLLGLKIDVDTYRGMRKGVPALLRSLKALGVKGTFYLSIGPDSSGRAVLQLVRNPRFIKKMFRTNAVGLYGFSTALYGTLLPAPQIALSFPDIVQAIRKEGHEVQFHAWDHRRWQDELPSRSTAWIREWFAKGVEGFLGLTGVHPTSFGAPAWLVDDRVMTVVREYPFAYLSCTRADEPFIHEDCGLVEIPSDLPCLEEIGAEEGLRVIPSLLQSGFFHVLPIHAEVEGGMREEYFMRLMNALGETDYAVVPLGVMHQTLSRTKLPVRRFRMKLLAGRSAPCAV